MSERQKAGSNLVLGLAIMLLGALTIVQGIQSRAEDKEQRSCLADNFGKLTEALTIRGDLTARDQNNRNRSDASQTKLIVQVFTIAKTPEDAKRIFAEFNAAQQKIKAETKAIAKEREAHPYPPFPPGTCDDGLPDPHKKKPESSKYTS